LAAAELYETVIGVLAAVPEVVVPLGVAKVNRPAALAGCVTLTVKVDGVAGVRPLVVVTAREELPGVVKPW